MAARKRFCKRGHEFTSENTRVRPNGTWQCRACHALYEQQRRERNSSTIATQLRVNRARRTDEQRAHDQAIAFRHSQRRKHGRCPDQPELADAYHIILRRDPCAYCGKRTEVIDHITALTRGGNAEWTNLTASCDFCNRKKWAHPLLTFLLKQLPADPPPPPALTAQPPHTQPSISLAAV